MVTTQKKNDSGEPLTFERILETGLGFCGLDPVSFYTLTIPELMAAARGRMEFLEMQSRANWECARFVSVAILQPHARKGKRVRPEDVATFPWEEKKEYTNNSLLADLKKYNAHGTG